MHWHEMTLVGFFCAQNQCRVFLPQVFSWQKSSVVCRIFSLKSTIPPRPPHPLKSQVVGPWSVQVIHSDIKSCGINVTQEGDKLSSCGFLINLLFYSLHAGTILLCSSSLSATQFLETVPRVWGTLATNFTLYSIKSNLKVVSIQDL